MKSNFLIIVVAVLTGSTALSQDPHFSQFQATPLMVNPANAGLKHDLQAVVNYRNQWSSLATPFQTTAFSFDMRTSQDVTRNAIFGLGIQLLNDRAGDANMSLTQANINLSSIINIDMENKISLGIMGGFGQRNSDFDRLKWESQTVNNIYNSALASNENYTNAGFSFFDAGAGLAWSFGRDQKYITANDGLKGSLGIAASHFNLPLASFYGVTEEKLQTKIVGHGQLEVGQRNSNLTFIPAFYLAFQGTQREILFGNTFRYILKEGSHFTSFSKSSAISLGAHYRMQDALIVNLQIDYANFSVGMGYDINVSTLSSASNMRGGFELFLRFVTPNLFGAGSKSKLR